ncbi:hypothetical protein AN641_03665 [Candidatus Epulonipiscioides gigas]|nr:hypothetical protein AN641_03665 [Epulopiscium sp. SCG-C07WGA-EpuloA2]
MTDVVLTLTFEDENAKTRSISKISNTITEQGIEGIIAFYEALSDDVVAKVVTTSKEEYIPS